MPKGSDGEEKPQCLLCSIVLCNANIKPSRLQEKFDNRHGRVKSGQDSESLKNKRVRFDSSETSKDEICTSICR